MFIEIRHLRTLAELRNSGNLARAAVRLHQTQSALSHQLKAIESYYDAPLFIRKSKPLCFTPLGERLLELADQLLPAIDRADHELKQLGGGRRGRLHIAIECHSCFDWLMPAMNRYREQWPEVEMDVSAGFAFDPVPALTRNQVDMVITSDPQAIKGLCFIPLFEYQAMLALAKGHALCDKPFVTPQDLTEQTLIIYPVEHKRLDIYTLFLDPAGVQPAGVRTSELTLMILQLVASNRGVAGLPSWVLAKYVEQEFIDARPLGQHGIWATLYAAVREDDRTLPYIKAFLDTARKTATSNLDDIKPCLAEAYLK